MRTDDRPRMVEIAQAMDVTYRGFTDFTLEMLEDQILGESSFDPTRDQVGAERDGTLIAAAMVTTRVSVVLIDPGHEDPRLWSELLAWTERRQSELGRAIYRVAAFAAFTPAIGAFREAGYELERVYAKMVRTFALTGPPEPAQLADGYRLVTVSRDSDLVALHALHERAFGERADHAPQSREEWVRMHISFSQFEPAWSLLAETTQGEPAGSLIGWRPPDHPHGYVAVLGVDPGHRHHGLGRALLLSAFGQIHAAGLPAAELHVASDNPNALGLYTGVGMVPDELFENYTRQP